MKKTTTLLFILLALPVLCMKGMSQESPAGPKDGVTTGSAVGNPAETSSRPESAVRQNAQSVQSNISNRQKTQQENKRDRRQDVHIAKKNLEAGTKETGEAAIRYKTRQNNQQTRKINEVEAKNNAQAIQKNVNFRQARRTEVEAYHSNPNVPHASK